MYKLKKNWADVILVLCLVLAFSFTMLEAHTQCLINTNPCSSSSGGYDPFGCNVSSGNPAQGAQNYINLNCPGVFIFTPPPTVQYVTSIPGDLCGFTDCAAGTIKIRTCDLCNSNSIYPSCPDICHTAAHEFAHWVYCNTGGAPAQSRCRELYIEIGAERYAYDYCLSMPYLTDPYCVTVRKDLKRFCDDYTGNDCANASSITLDEKNKVTEWCMLCTCVMMLPPGSKFCEILPEEEPATKIYLCTGKDVGMDGACDLELLEDCGMMNPPKTCMYDTITNCPACI